VTTAAILQLAIVSMTACGLSLQCWSSYQSKRAEYLSFPMAIFLLLPYPVWALVGWLRDDVLLWLMMALVGVPNIVLSLQYFRYEWPRLSTPRFASEDKIALLLIGLGLLMALVINQFGTLEQAAAAMGAWFTSCLMVYSYLVKIWRVLSGTQTIDGLRWLVLWIVALQYVAMIYHGGNTGIPLLQLGYGFALFSVLLAMAYKFRLERQLRLEQTA